MTGSESFVPITFTSPASVTAGTQYSIVALTNDSSSWFWHSGQGVTPDSAYLGGRLYGSTDGPPAMGTWTGGSPADFEFKTYVAPPPPPPPPPPGTGGASGGGTSATGERAAALKKCKKKRSQKAKKKCRKKAQLLPV